MGRILIVESERGTMRQATMCLVDSGFTVAQAYDSAEALGQLEHAPDAIILDLYLRGGGGLGLCRRLRRGTAAPILVLTEIAQDGDVEDGLDDGADDYLIKPFAEPVLVARLRSLLRRAGRRALGEHTLQVRDLVIDQQRLQVLMAGHPVYLTPTEWRILSCLARNAGRVMTSRELLKDAQGYECEEQEAQDIVKVHVNHLRQKIEADPSNPSYIVNVRGFGYMLERRTYPG